MIYRIWQTKTFKWTVLITAAMKAVRLFFVQELIAAFLIFSVVFICLTGVLLIVFLLGHVVDRGLAWAGAHKRHFGHAARRGRESVEALAVNQLQEFYQAASQK